MKTRGMRVRKYWTRAQRSRKLSRDVGTTGEGNRQSSLGSLRQVVVAALVGVTLVCAPTAGSAYQILQQAQQPQAIDPATGRITVEASVIHVVACNGAGENGGQFYIYQYVLRPGFRAILPPNWGHALGGRDYPTFEQAVAVACGQGITQPAPQEQPSQSQLGGNWGYAAVCGNDRLTGMMSLSPCGDGIHFCGSASGTWYNTNSASITGGTQQGNEVRFDFTPTGWTSYYIWQGRFISDGRIDGTADRAGAICNFTMTR